MSTAPSAQAYMNTPTAQVEIKIVKYPAQIGFMSCVGIGRYDYPIPFGNYFSLSNGPYIVNMWAENFKEIVRRNNIQDVWCTEFSHNNRSLAFVTDKRIKPEWFNKRLCVTGHGWGTRALCEAALGFAGLPVRNEICGCEAPDQAPSIGCSFSFSNPITTYRCNNCGRWWESTER